MRYWGKSVTPSQWSQQLLTLHLRLPSNCQLGRKPPLPALQNPLTERPGNVIQLHIPLWSNIIRIIGLKYLSNGKIHCWTAIHLHGNTFMYSFLWYCLNQNPGWRILFFSPQRSATVWNKLQQLHEGVRTPFPIKSVNVFCFCYVNISSQKCSTYVYMASDSYMHEWL